MRVIFSEFIFKRIIASLLMMLILVSVVFFMMHLLPGDPFQQYYSPKLGNELAEQIKNKFGLDKSVSVQFLNWIKNVIQGDFGYSLVYKRPVGVLLIESLLVTLSISLTAFILQIFITIPLGLFLLKNSGRRIDLIIDKIALIVYSAPSFVVAIILIYLGSIVLKIFPSSQMISYNYYEMNSLEKLMDLIHHLTLPILTLTITSVSFSIRYLRESLINVSKEGFVLSLRANGIPEKIIRKRHILPNALISYITILGIEIGSLLSKTLITETVFSLPGMGKLMVSSIFTRDYPVIIACVMISGFMVILGNLIADILIAKFNPKFSYEVVSH
ncbi:MAG: ABC transporter permease [Ignavibacteria bacterium]